MYVQGNWGYCNHQCLLAADGDANSWMMPDHNVDIVEDNDENQCKTTLSRTDSPLRGRGKSCIFPFTVMENQTPKTFHGCTTELTDPGLWCSTKVDGNGMHVQGNWGYCNNKCHRDGSLSIRPPETGISIENIQKLSPCHTDGGPKKEKPCVFPFTFEGKKYNTCTVVSKPVLEKYSDTLVKPWCSTGVDANGNYITGEWGFCDWDSCLFQTLDKECKTYSGPKNDDPCKFPFTFNGEVHENCITTDDRCGVPWCPTEDNENVGDVEFGSWGYCNHYCPDGQPA